MPIHRALGARTDPGFDPEGLVTARLELPTAADSKEARLAGLGDLLEQLEALPGVESAALAGSRLPLTGGPGNFELYVEDRPRGPRPDVVANAQVVSPRFFHTLGVPLRALGFDPARLLREDG